MRQITQRGSAVGSLPWVPFDYAQSPVALTLAVLPSAGATISYTVQITTDPTETRRNITSLIQTASTTVTVIDPLHGASTLDSVTVVNSGSPITDGVFDITVVDANTYTYVAGTSQTYTGSNLTQVNTLRVFPHATLGTSQVARAQGTVAFPIRAYRLNVATLTGTNATVDFNSMQGIAS